MTNWDRTEPASRPSTAGHESPPAAAADAPRPDRAPEPSTPGGGRGLDPDRGPKRAKPIGAVVAALVVGLLLGAGGALALDAMSGDDGSTADDFGGVVDTARYQAVILTNDKVYFGRIRSVSDDFYELDSAFFLRETRESEDAEPQRALLPVNREIHAPDNAMLIRKDEVVLVENLAQDSPILEEIKRQKG